MVFFYHENIVCKQSCRALKPIVSSLELSISFKTKYFLIFIMRNPKLSFQVKVDCNEATGNYIGRENYSSVHHIFLFSFQLFYLFFAIMRKHFCLPP